MSVLIVALLGVAMVLALVLILKLHPLLSLLVASLFVLLATPLELQWKTQLAEHQRKVVSVAGNRWQLDEPAQAGSYRVWDRTSPIETWQKIELAWSDDGESYSVTSAGDEPAIEAGSFLVAEQHFAELSSSRVYGLGSRLAAGFNKTFRKLGIPVTMAAIIGACLLKSGAASRLVLAIAGLFGPKGTAFALTISGFVLGIPVFFDNVFYLLLPLAKAAGRSQPAKFLTLVMAIIVGATMAHSLVPPTPGPLFVCGELGVSVGSMMIGGFIVGAIAASCGFGYGVLCNRWITLSPEDVVDESGAGSEDKIETQSKRMPLAVASLPLGIPLLLLGGSEILEFAYGDDPQWGKTTASIWAQTMNEPSLIFIAAALAAAVILLLYSDRDTLRGTIAKGLTDAGVIVLLTCAGGAFGASLQQLDLAGLIGSWAKSTTDSNTASGFGLLTTAFVLTAIIRGAQGSATVAMVTSSAIISPVLASATLPFHPVYLALAIGCGSKPLPWMNDSGFWQVNTMTGMTPQQTLQTFSVALTIMGCVGFAVTLLGAWLVPLVP